jgi:pseudouridine-5'-monophosphatase
MLYKQIQKLVDYAITQNKNKELFFFCSFLNLNNLIYSLDTEPVYEGVFKELCEKYGKQLTSDVRCKLLGSTEQRACELCVNDLKLNVSIEQFVAEFRELSQQRLANVDFMPGAEKLIRHLYASNIPICVATSSCEDSVVVKTQKHEEVFKLFHHITKGNEVKQGKPAPDIFLLAASRFTPQANPTDVC